MEEIREEIDALKEKVEELPSWQPLHIPEYPGIDEMEVWEKYEEFRKLFMDELRVLTKRINNLEKRVENYNETRSHYTSFLLDKISRLEYALGYRDSYDGELNLKR